MATRDIYLWPDPILSEDCARVAKGDPDIEMLITDLIDTMYQAKGRGLASPQIGVAKRVFVVDAHWKERSPDPIVFINPILLNQSGETSCLSEQCLSIPDIAMNVTRSDRIQLHWETVDGYSVNMVFDGIEARCILHELDHLNGIVIFNYQTPDARADLEAKYAK